MLLYYVVLILPYASNYQIEQLQHLRVQKGGQEMSDLCKRRVALKLSNMCRISNKLGLCRGKKGRYFLIGAFIFNSDFPHVVPELSLFYQTISIYM